MIRCLKDFKSHARTPGFDYRIVIFSLMLYCQLLSIASIINWYCVLRSSKFNTSLWESRVNKKFILTDLIKKYIHNLIINMYLFISANSAEFSINVVYLFLQKVMPNLNQQRTPVNTSHLLLGLYLINSTYKF